MYLLAMKTLEGEKAINRRLWPTIEIAEYQAEWTHGGNVYPVDANSERGMELLKKSNPFS